MASPFHTFRKNQKVLIVIVGLMAMISFVILAPLMDVIGGGGSNSPDNPLVLTSDYGDLREYDVERLRLQQSILYSFLNQADQERWMADGRDPSGWRPSRPNQVDTGYAIQTYLLANKADEMGIVVDDAVINNKLEQYKIGGDRIRELLRGYQMGDSPMTIRQLFEAYRIDIKASRVRQAYGLAVPGRPRTTAPTIYTPAQSFENYKQLHDQIQIESVAVPVEQFVDQIEDPSEAELKKFYEKYKDQLDVPMNVGGVQMPAPEPGFKFPPKASFHYLEGNYLAYVDLAREQVTQEEIKQYYEDNKRQYEKLNLLDAPGEASPGGLDLNLPELDDPAGTPLPESAPSTPKEKPAAEPKTEAPAEGDAKQPGEKTPADKKEPAAEEKPATDSEKPADEKSAEKPAEKPAAPEEPADEQPAEKPKAEPESEPQSGISTNEAEGLVLTTALPTQFVNLQDDPESAPAAATSAEETSEEKPAAKQDEKPAPAESNTEPKTEEPKSEEPAPKDPATPAEKKEPAQEEPAADPAKQPAEDGSTDPENSDVDIPDAKSPAGEEKKEAPAKKPAKEYKPLEEVEDEIRQELANQRAGLSMMEAMQPLKEELDEYWTRATRRKLTAGDKGVAELPPGFLDKAKASNLVFKETQFPLSYFELNDIPLGQASVPMDAGLAGTSNVPLAQYAFLGQMTPFQAVLAEGDDGNKYLAWKVSDQEERVPDLDEIKDQVVHAWKMVEARKLAEKEAKRLADKAKDLQVPLDRAFGDEDYAVQFSSPFTWLTRGSAHQFDFNAQLRLGEISGITGANNEFMQKIFDLKEGEITSLMNYPQDTAYVVRLSQRVIPVDELREQYLRDEQTPAFFRPWDQLAQQRVMTEVNDALLAEVEQEANVIYHESEDVDEMEE